ncbi:aldose epimerase family protein [Limosilactobacillus mucosae]
MEIKESSFGTFEGQEVKKYTLINDQDMQVSVLNYAGLLQEISVPGKDGKRVNLVLSAADIEHFTDNGMCNNRVIGRVAGRLAKGEFTIDGQEYHVDTNENGNTLHGGPNGLGNQFFEAETVTTPNTVKVVLTKTMTPEIDSFPGNEKVTVTYSLSNDNRVVIDLDGETDANTLFNPTVHTYFNLGDSDAATVEDQVLQVNSKFHLDVDDEKIPTGKKLVNAGTPFGFQTPRRLGDALNEMKSTKEGGFDDIWQVEPSTNVNHEPVATLSDPASGRKMKLYSDRNGLVMYTANGMDKSLQFNRPSASWCALAMEAQTLSDTPHHPEFGDITLRPGKPAHHRIVYAIEF